MEIGSRGALEWRIPRGAERKVCFISEMAEMKTRCVGSEADSHIQKTKRRTKYVKQIAQEEKCYKQKLEK